MDEILDLESEVTATFNKNENLDKLHSLLHTNDLSDITEGSVIITEVPERDETLSSGTMNSKGPYLRAAKLTRTAAKDVIMEALDFLDKEAEDLRTLNNSYIVENGKIKEENEKLKRELEELRTQRATMLNNLEKIETENVKLKSDIRSHMEKLKEEKKRSEAIHSKLLDENTKFVKQIENLRKEATIREAQLYDKSQELEQLKKRLEDINRRNNNEHHMELLHEVEMLKSERRNFHQEKGATEEENKNLKEEINNLENTLETKISELNNENRRHFVLTKEFNSLLEENSRLKQQIRSRAAPGTPSTTRKLNSSMSSGRNRQITAETVDQLVSASGENHPMGLPLKRSNTQMSLPVRGRPSNPNLMARTHTAVFETNQGSPSSSRTTQDENVLSEPLGALPTLATSKGNWKP